MQSLPIVVQYCTRFAIAEQCSVLSSLIQFFVQFFLHCQVILVQGCHIANIPFTQSSYTELSSIYTAKWYSYMVVILQTIHLHYQVIHGCHIANNPFTLSSDTHTGLSYCKQSFYTIKSYMVVILRTIHLHCQVILVQGCHIANNPLTLSSHTWLSYC
jgi:hypothetical protein